MKDNETILLKRTQIWDKIKGPRVGDYLRVGDKYTRFTHDGDDHLQTGGCCHYANGKKRDGRYYFGKGYMSYSGALDKGVAVSDIEETDEIREGPVWFFNNDEPGKDNAVYFEILCRVYTIKPDTDISGLWEIDNDN